MSFQSDTLYNCDWCKNANKKHWECKNADIYQLETETITDRATLKCNNYKKPVFPYINYPLLYNSIPQHLQGAIKDTLTIKKLLESFFESIRLLGRVKIELYEEAYKIAERNRVELSNIIEGDLEFFI
jgi:hypothetical protein